MSDRETELIETMPAGEKTAEAAEPGDASPAEKPAEKTEVMEKVEVIEEPETEGLPAALAATAPRRWSNRATPVLGAVVLLAGGFLGGVQVQKQWGKETNTSTATRQTQGRSGPPSFGGQMPGGRSATGQETAGTVTAVTADALTVRTAAGATVTVKIAGGTKVLRATTAAGLRAGQSVTVQGSTATDGTITATAVTAS